MTEWRKSSYSPNSNDCVEVGARVGIRDSKAPVVHLPLSPSAWTAFLCTVKGITERDRFA